MSTQPSIQTRELDGTSFEFANIGFDDQVTIFMLLVHKVAPAVQELLAGNLSWANVLRSANPDSVARALNLLVENLDAKDLKFLNAKFGVHSKVLKDDGTWVAVTTQVMGEIFRGRLTTYFAWLYHCIEVNYSDFFTLLPDPESGESGSPPPAQE